VDLFTTSTISRLFELLRSIGYLEALTAAVAAIAYGVGYVVLRRGLAHTEPVDLGSLAGAGARVTLGAIFFVMGGLNGFLRFVPDHPSSMRESCLVCQQFLEGILSTGYLFPLVKGVELAAGAMLIAGLWVPLASVLLAPVVVNIFLYHLFLNPAGLPLAVLILALQCAVAWRHREMFAPLLRPRRVAAAERPHGPGVSSQTGLATQAVAVPERNAAPRA
jgi:hypothetical protein